MRTGKKGDTTLQGDIACSGQDLIFVETSLGQEWVEGLPLVAFQDICRLPVCCDISMHTIVVVFSATQVQVQGHQEIRNMRAYGEANHKVA